MSRIPGFLHINDDGTAVWVTEDSVSAPQQPVADLSDVVRSITLNSDTSDRFTESGPITLRFYAIDDGAGEGS